MTAGSDFDPTAALARTNVKEPSTAATTTAPAPIHAAVIAGFLDGCLDRYALLPQCPRGDTMPDVATVVVAQSDELAAWVGVVGVVVGVF
ncbi:MAG: hypothetical protein ACLQFR_09650 [Streptosporangiaceae bacterium]